MVLIADILRYKYPGTIWSVTERDYNSLVWHAENTQPKPSEQELWAYEQEVDLLVRWDLVRRKRDKLLTACDWTQISDAPLSAEQKAAWALYRQNLRDIPQQPTEPENVVWPIEP